MYLLYTTESPATGTLDTSDVKWVLLCEAQSKRQAERIIAAIATHTTRPWRRWRLFRHPKGRTLGRLVAEGEWSAPPSTARAEMFCSRCQAWRPETPEETCPTCGAELVPF
jgi:hypothetical protein